MARVWFDRRKGIDEYLEMCSKLIPVNAKAETPPTPTQAMISRSMSGFKNCEEKTVDFLGTSTERKIMNK